MYDFIIIGAGVVGTMIARELSRYESKILLLDKENDVSCGASKANSGIVHGGYDATHGKLKSQLVRKGNIKFKQLNEELNFGYEACGSLVLAFDKEQVGTLNELMENGKLNSVDDLVILDREEVLALEPHVNKNVYKALYCPSAGITSPYEMTIALAENAVANGCEISLLTAVEDIEKIDQGFNVITNKGIYQSQVVINCAGVYSDVIASFLGVDNFRIIPRRGEYVLLNKNQGHLANRVIFQTPTTKGKGILVTKTYHGNLMLGPNAQEINDKEEVGTTLDVLKYIVKTARQSIPGFNVKMTLTSFAGIRATSNTKDFIIEESNVKGFINVAGIDSPGLTSSPAIADYVIDLIKKAGNPLKAKESFNPYRKAVIVKKEDDFKGAVDDSNKEQTIICRCEKVTEAEIIDALNRGIDLDSLDAIKRRTRAGMGPCQGKFCSPRVAKIIAREKNMPIEEVTLRGKGSSILPPRENRTFWKELEL